MPFYRISEMEARFVDMGKARLRSVAGEFMKAGVITYPEDGGPPPHFHPNEEQFLLVTEGEANVILGEETRAVRPGDLVLIRRNERHGLRVLEGPFSFFTVKSPAGDGDLYQDYNRAADAEEARKKLEAAPPPPERRGRAPFYRMEDLPRGASKVGPAVSHATAGELMKAGWVIYPQGEGPPAHFHPNEEQFILMLEGRMNMICGEEAREVRPGDLVHVPRNARHGIRITRGPAKFFAVKSPAGDGTLDQDYNRAADADEVRERLANPASG